MVRCAPKKAAKLRKEFVAHFWNLQVTSNQINLNLNLIYQSEDILWLNFAQLCRLTLKTWDSWVSLAVSIEVLS